jgi:hypothetical protein
LNTYTVALRVVRGDKMGTQCLGVLMGHPVPGGYKYGDLALQVGGVSKSDKEISWDFGAKNECTGKAHQQLQTTH